MLTLQPSLMANMGHDHLIRSLECEPQIMRTPVELELMARCERLADELADRPTEAEMEKRYESPLEQSEFRAQLIKEIIELCDRPGSKKDLVSAIKMALENSYVEL
ncbi:MAG TPA: hypothetical protein PKI24_23395 [Nitrospira sp.]|nr:hypothetical protein [Anaerolineales bacterium]HNP42512.1 hypothetical protein [Nitrospira sp.]